MNFMSFLVNWKPATVGWIVFIVVPGGLWVLGALANRGHGPTAKILGFTVGSDNRLSLSRLQAFLWTLVIFGSYAAAMSIHSKITPGTPEEVGAAAKKVTDTAADEAAKKTGYDAALADEQKAVEASKAADAAAAADAAHAKVADEASKADKTNTTLAKEAADDASKALHSKEDAAAKAAVLLLRHQAVTDAQGAWKQAKDEAENAKKTAENYAWVQIPAALLALAGIAIGSGVFSSLIAAVNGDAKTACVTDLSSVVASNLTVPQGVNAETPRNLNANCVVITGSDLGDSGNILLGRTRFGKQAARVIYWKKDGTGIAAELPDVGAYSTLVVETSNGKLAYGLSGSSPNLQLGAPRTQYDFADLFRDDQNPESLSLMKFQMFGWTVIAIFIYVYLFLSNLSPSITTLPVVDSSIAILTGVSQAGYLGGKGVSNVAPSPTSS
ncbi:MAG TPA: hypothetical protein VG206_26150 [Terriglobia bacterium]|nr:hypothetical protein [Terriglobia bacterium]